MNWQPIETEHDLAREWRRRTVGSMDKLSELSGYSKSAILWMERGQATPPKGSKRPRRLDPYAWQRYRRVCHSVHLELAGHEAFAW